MEDRSELYALGQQLSSARLCSLRKAAEFSVASWWNELGQIRINILRIASDLFGLYNFPFYFHIYIMFLQNSVL